MHPKLTVLVPTLNRRELLDRCLESLVDQDAEDDVIVRVFDSGSTDGTPAYLASLQEPTIEVFSGGPARNLFHNWSRAVDTVTTPYLAIVADDDCWRSGYARKAIQALDAHPDAALTFCDVELQDGSGNRIGARRTPFPAGRFPGLDYLERVVNGENIIVDSSAAVIRTDVFRSVGGLDGPHMNHDIIFNYQFRLAFDHHFVRIPETMVGIGVHDDQGHLQSAGSKAAIGMTAERMEAAARLLASPRAADEQYRGWLSERLIDIGRLRSQYSAEEIPGLKDPATERLSRARERALVLTKDYDILVVAGDDLVYDPDLNEARTVRPFPEIDGSYAGVPDSDEAAISELASAIDGGATHFVVAWPSFWWLDYYHGLRHHLADHHLMVNSSDAVIYRLTNDPRPPSAEVAGDG